jgi:hypothetical protein
MIPRLILNTLSRTKRTVRDFLATEVTVKRLDISIRNILSLAVGGLFLLFVGFGTITILPRVLAWLNVTAKVGPIDIPTAVTFLVVDGLLELIRSVFGKKAHEPRVQVWNQERSYPIAGCTYHGVSVLNRGTDGARSCQARLTLRVKQNDILNIGNKKTIITKRKFSDVNDIPIRWVTQNEKNIDLRPDITNMEPLIFLRVVPANAKVPLHFEIPSINGWSPSLVALKPDDYEGRIKVSPMNSTPASQTFVINYKSKKRSVTLSFPTLFFEPIFEERSS